MGDFYSQTTPTPSLLGEPALGVRKDTAVDLASADGKLTVPQFDSYGAKRVTSEGGRPTYRATSQFACDSTATDIAAFPGVAGVTAKVQRVFISSTATAAATGDLTIVRRSTADTAGTAVSASVGKMDTRNAAASVQPTHYTAHPTALGTGAGVLHCERFVQQAAGTPQASRVEIDFQQRQGGQGLRVQGATDLLYINVSAALGGTGNAWDVTWEWTEEPTTA